MPHEPTNVVHLSVFHRQLDEEVTDIGGNESEPTEAPKHSAELHAIAGCLDYLYAEVKKLDQHMTAHLIGAAAESLRQEAGGHPPEE